MILAEKVKGKDGKPWIKVTFSTYCYDYAKAVSRIPGAIYVKPQKAWGIPYEYREIFDERTRSYLVRWKGEKIPHNGGIDEETIPEQPIVPGYSVEYGEGEEVISATGFKVPPFGKFQVRGFNAIVQRNFLILADAPGLGKTWQTVTAIEAKKKLGQLKRGVVVVKSSLLYNWRDEILKYTYETPVVMTGSKDRRQALYQELAEREDWTFLIISYDTFRNDIKLLQELDDLRPLDFMVLDEAQMIKNPTSKIGTVIHHLPVKYKYILTATPLINSPLEAYSYFKFGGVIDMNWYQFRNKYAIMGGFRNKTPIAPKNVHELQKLLSKHMLRRTKEDKLKTLPKETFKLIGIEMTELQRKYYRNIKNEIIEELGDLDVVNLSTAMVKMLRLQQVTNSLDLLGVPPSPQNSAKLDALDELLESIIDTAGEKVIVFTKFKQFADILVKRYGKYNPAVITGDVDSAGVSRQTAIRRLKKQYDLESMEPAFREKLITQEMTSERQKEVYRFQQDDNCKLFIGTSGACREGLTLTAATHVIFTDLEWAFSYIEQAYGRAHRKGQENPVTVVFLYCKDSIDEFVLERVMTKKDVIDTLMGEDIEQENTLNRDTIKRILATDD